MSKGTTRQVIFLGLVLACTLFGAFSQPSIAQAENESKVKFEDSFTCLKDNAGKKYLSPAKIEPCLNPTLAIQSPQTTFPWIFSTWRWALSIVNVFAVIILIVMAFANIIYPLQTLEPYRIRQLLPGFISGIVLANLSLFICRAIVAFADLLMTTGGLQVSLQQLFLAWGFDPAKLASGVIEAKYGADNYALNIGGMTYQLIISTILIYLPIIGMFILSFIFYIRFAVIFFLTAISPLAFASIMLPETKKYLNQWWDNFWRWTFGGVASYILLRVAAQISTTSSSLYSGGKDSVIDVIPYLISLSIVYLAIVTPFQMGGKIAAAWGNVGKFLARRSVSGAGIATGLRKGGYARNFASQMFWDKRNPLLNNPFGREWIKRTQLGGGIAEEIRETKVKKLKTGVAASEMGKFKERRKAAEDVLYREKLQKIKKDHPDMKQEDAENRARSEAKLGLTKTYDTTSEGIYLKRLKSIVRESVKERADNLKNSNHRELLDRINRAADARGWTVQPEITPEMSDYQKDLARLKAGKETRRKFRTNLQAMEVGPKNYEEYEELASLMQAMLSMSGSGKQQDKGLAAKTLYEMFDGMAVGGGADVVSLPEVNDKTANQTDQGFSTGVRQYAGESRDDLRGLIAANSKLSLEDAAKRMQGFQLAPNQFQKLEKAFKNAIVKSAKQGTPLPTHLTTDLDGLDLGEINREQMVNMLHDYEGTRDQNFAQTQQVINQRMNLALTSNNPQELQQLQQRANVTLNLALEKTGLSMAELQPKDIQPLHDKLEEQKTTVKRAVDVMAHESDEERRVTAVKEILGEVSPSLGEKVTNQQMAETVINGLMEDHSVISTMIHNASHASATAEPGKVANEFIKELKGQLGEYAQAKGGPQTAQIV